MERIAFIGVDTFLYWSPIVIAMAAAAAIAFYAAVYTKKGGSIVALSLSLPIAILLSVVLSRLIHWYCRSGAYDSFQSAMTDYSHGGYALLGVFLGSALSACLVRLVRASRNLPAMLDSMAIGGGIGIALGRLACLFNNQNRGMVVPEDLGFPFAYPLTNAVTGVSENRLATFMLQSMVTGAIIAALLVYMAWCAIKKKKIRDGDICLLFLLAYGASQIVFDSTRYDSLVLRSNGFVSMVQIVGLVAVVMVIAVFSVRMVKSRGLKPWQFAIWGGILAMFGLAGYMEYFVQNTGAKALLGYSIMSAALIVAVALTLLIRWLGGRKQDEPEAVPEQKATEMSGEEPEQIPEGSPETEPEAVPEEASEEAQEEITAEA